MYLLYGLTVVVTLLGELGGGKLGYVNLLGAEARLGSELLIYGSKLAIYSANLSNLSCDLTKYCFSFTKEPYHNLHFITVAKINFHYSRSSLFGLTG